MPALPLDEAGRYVAGAYVVFLALLLIYVAIMAAKLQRLDRDLTQLNAELDAREREDAEPAAGEGAPAVPEREPA